MRKSNLYLVTVLFVFSVVLAVYSGSGSYYWDDGEIVRGKKINSALDEKLSQSGETYFQLEPTASFATSAAEIGTFYMNASGAINFLSTGTTWMTILATTTGLEW